MDLDNINDDIIEDNNIDDKNIDDNNIDDNNIDDINIHHINFNHNDDDVNNNSNNDIIDVEDANLNVTEKNDQFTIATKLNDELHLAVTLDDIKKRSTKRDVSEKSDDDSVTDSLIERLWDALELKNRLSTRSDNQTPLVSRVSVADYVPVTLPPLSKSTLRYKFEFLDQKWKFIDDEIIRSPRTSKAVNEAIQKIESKSIDEYIIDQFENEVQKILNKGNNFDSNDIIINTNNNNDNNIAKSTSIDSSDESEINGLSYYDAQEVAISLASIRMFYKQRDFGSMFKPSIILSEPQESSRLNLSPEKTEKENSVVTLKKNVNVNKSKNSNINVPSVPSHSKSSKSSPRKAPILFSDKGKQKEDMKNNVNVAQSEIARYFNEWIDEKGHRKPLCLQDK